MIKINNQFKSRIIQYLLVLMLIICIGLLVTACKNNKEKSSASEKFVGEWLDTNSERCNMIIECEDSVNYSIDINWSQSESENYHWVFVGKYDAKKDGILYTGRKILQGCNENGDLQETIVYDDGKGILYLERNGRLYWDDYEENAGEKCSFEKTSMSKNEEELSSQENFVVFSEDWYKTYKYFKSDSNELLKVEILDDGLLHVKVNDVEYFACNRDEYVKTEEQAYVYNDLWDDLQLKYYPTENNRLVMVVMGEETSYYPISSTEVSGQEETSKVYYITDTVKGKDLSVKVLYAYSLREYGNLYVKILCDITNTTGKTLFFDTSEYFDLNNNGIMKSGSCDYDCSELSSGASFQTTISFMYPKSANTSWWNMTLTVDGRTVCLLNDAGEAEEFEGVYYKEDGSPYCSIVHLYDNKYQWIMYNSTFNELNIREFTLNADSTFSPYTNSDPIIYSWSSESNSISYSKTEEVMGEDYTRSYTFNKFQ